MKNFLQMGNRFFLFIAVNLLVMLTLTIVFQIVLHFSRPLISRG